MYVHITHGWCKDPVWLNSADMTNYHWTSWMNCAAVIKLARLLTAESWHLQTHPFLMPEPAEKASLQANRGSCANGCYCCKLIWDSRRWVVLWCKPHKRVGTCWCFTQTLRSSLRQRYAKLRTIFIFRALNFSMRHKRSRFLKKKKYERVWIIFLMDTNFR